MGFEGYTGGGGGGGTTLTPGADGAVPVSKSGAWEVGVDKAVKAASVTATDVSATGSLNGQVTITEGADTCAIDATSLTFNTTEVTGTQLGVATTYNPSQVAPQGRLIVPPAYTQVSGDAAVALTSANHRIAIGGYFDIEWQMTALSAYITAISTTGDMAVSVCADSTALEPNGDFNNMSTEVTPTMVSNTSPAPWVFHLYDKNAADAETASYEAYRAVDGSSALNNEFRSNAAPSASDPIYFTIDCGAGTEKIINRFQIQTNNNVGTYGGNGIPSAFTFWGSNAATPTVNTDDDWTQLTGSRSWTAEPKLGYNTEGRYYGVVNSTPYRHYRLKITDRNGVTAYCSIGTFRMWTAESVSAPGSVISDLGTGAVGAAADAWVRHTFNAVQFIPQTKYWIVFGGQASKNWSMSVRQNNTTAASMFPDGWTTKQTTDGATWTQSLQNSRLPAFMNVVLQSTAHHASPLVYGREIGANVALHSGSAWVNRTIPAAGIILDCEALSVLTLYRAYLYDNSGTLTLEAVATALTSQDGIAVKSGATGHLLVGRIGVINRTSTYQGPADISDSRLLRNHYRPRLKMAEKRPGYTGATTEWVTMLTWDKALSNDDFTVHFVSGPEDIHAWIQVFIESGYGTTLAVGFDSLNPPLGDMLHGGTSTASPNFTNGRQIIHSLDAGYHRSYLLRRSNILSGTIDYAQASLIIETNFTPLSTRYNLWLPC